VPEHAHQRRGAFVNVNDTPYNSDLTRHAPSGGYFPRGRTMPVQVSFVAEDGSYWRVSFDPQGADEPGVRRMPREADL
jgi:hypothetical protein